MRTQRGFAPIARFRRASRTTKIGVIALTAVLIGAGSVAAAVAATGPTAPTITSAPAATTSSTTATFAFTDATAKIKFQCRLGTAAFADCASPKTYSALAQGSFTFQVKALLGSQTSSTTSYSWTVDNTPPPAPTFTAKPARLSSVASPTFGLADSESHVRLECTVDGAAFAPCSTPITLTGLSQGAHAFAAQAIDAAGNHSGTVSWSWVIDSIAPPAPTIMTKPASLSNTTSPRFDFADSEPGVGLECKLENRAFTACASPQTYSNLAEGSHSFSLRALDAAGNISGVASWIWKIDSIPPPVPVFTTKPANPSSTAATTFGWTDGEPGATYRCSLENGSWQTCATPYSFTAGAINNGQHQFAVQAVDSAGNISGNASYIWKITLTRMPFGITGSVTGIEIGVWSTAAVMLTNPNSVPISVTGLTVAVSAQSTPFGCPSSGNIEVSQSNASATLTVNIPANGSILLPAGTVTAPRIRLINLPTVNQDVCKGKSFALSYSGTATS
jgi:hypothetical protein